MVKKKRIYAFPLLPGKFRGKSADSTRPRFLCSCFLHALVRPHPLPSSLKTFRRAKDEWRNLLCHFKSSLPFLSSPILDSIVLLQEITIKIQELTHRKDIYETKNLALRCRGREKERKRERRKLMEMTRKQRKRPVGIQKTKEASFRGVEESTGRGEGQN